MHRLRVWYSASEISALQEGELRSFPVYDAPHCEALIRRVHDVWSPHWQPFVTYAVKFAYVVHGSMEIAVKPDTEADWKLHLRSKLVWETAHESASSLLYEDMHY